MTHLLTAYYNMQVGDNEYLSNGILAYARTRKRLIPQAGCT